MIYGSIKLVKKGEKESVIRVNNTKVTLHKGDNIKVLSDPNIDDIHGNCELFNITYDEFLNGFDEYDELTDDLGYVYGIAVD